jgi:NADPH-dependent 2,4-dienoyl-CoA reductase/sulfur reductase-like enzyme
MAESSLAFDVVVIGAGPAGLAAACAVAESGRPVAVVDDTPWLGGQIWRGQQAHPSLPQARSWIERFQRSGATVLNGTAVIAAPTPGVLMAERDQQPLQIRWQRLILATGARELFLPFPGWTLPGVMGPGGLLNLAKNGWPVARQQVLVAGTGPLLLAAAAGVRKRGAAIISIIEQAPFSDVANFALHLGASPAKLWQALQLRLALFGAPYRCGVWPVRADGNGQLRQVTLTDGRQNWTEPCDLFACAFGLIPNVELPLLLGCELKNQFVAVDQWQATSAPNIYCAGEPTGLGGADCALVEGQIAGYAACGQLAKAEALFPARTGWHRFRNRLATAFALRPELKSLAADETIFCRCEDVTLGQVRRFSDSREAKLHTRCGMGACQGRVCGAAARVILGWVHDSVRSPVLPVRVGSLVSGGAPEIPAPSRSEAEAPQVASSPVAKSQAHV